VRPERSELILIVAPIGRDAELMCSHLTAAGLACETCEDIDELCSRIGDRVGAVIVTEEALPSDKLHLLTNTLLGQPAWSEIPLVILSGAPSLDAKPRSFDALMRRTNITLVDRPVRIKSLISAARSALRARQRQYEIRDLMLQLEERIHERDRFLAVLGHELRNPLGAILLAAQMTGEDGKLEAEHAEMIERQSLHLTRLVNDLLDLSRVAAGKIVLKPQVLSLEKIAAQSLSTASPMARKQRIELAMHVSPKPLLIYADPVRVDQIITNIVTNAVKYTPEGGHVTVDIAEAEGHAVLRVTDDGVGIAPDRINGIFEIFAQAENAIGRAQGGMGIGLALVRNLVQLHDGSVEAKSDGIGHGSEFVVRLPLAKEEQLRGFDQQPQPGETAGPPAAGRRIVIVEDNKDVRELLRLKLSRLGHEVVDARDGEEGLRMVVEAKPDLALIDLGLPGIDGFEVARGVREQLGGEVVLVAVSGFGQPEDKRKAIEAGFDEHITKPADVKDIEGVLRRFPPRRPVAEIGSRG
jgi:signal transduction histidine kinase/ActR/RegA family two-component response regulator